MSGTMKPAARIAEFFASAVSRSEFAIEPACPNCTSVVNIFAHVPMAQAMMGFLMTPFLTASMTRYSSIPPTSPSRTSSLHSGSAS